MILTSHNLYCKDFLSHYYLSTLLLSVYRILTPRGMCFMSQLRTVLDGGKLETLTSTDFLSILLCLFIYISVTTLELSHNYPG